MTGGNDDRDPAAQVPESFSVDGMPDELQRAVEDLAKRIDRSVALDNSDLKLLAHSAHLGEEDEARLESLVRREVTNERASWARQKGVFSSLVPLRTPAEPQLGLRPRYVVPLRAGRQLLGVLWIIDDGALDDSVERDIRDTSERIKVILVRRLMRADDRGRQVEASVLNLISGDEAAIGEGAAALQDFGIFHPRCAFVCIAITPIGQLPVQSSIVVEAVKRAVGRLAQGTAPALVDQTVLVVMGIPIEWGGEQITATMQAVIRELYEADRRLPASLIVSSGGAVADLAGVSQSYDQATATSRIAGRVGGSVWAWGSNELDEMLASVLVPDLPAHMLPRSIQTLESVLPEEIETTVQTYLDEAGNATRTAEHLHVHRATVYYRLARFEELTRLKLDDGRTRFMLQFWYTVRNDIHLS